MQRNITQRLNHLEARSKAGGISAGTAEAIRVQILGLDRDPEIPDSQVNLMDEEVANEIKRRILLGGNWRDRQLPSI